MFNFFKKTKSKDNSSSKANNKNKKGKQTDAPSFLTRKNNTKQESESNNLACEALKSLRITTETVGCVEPEVMGNTESKSQASSPGLNKIGGKESLEHSASPPTVVNSARAEFFHVDKNSNGIIEKADCSPSTSTSSPTVSDLLRGINSDESASNERSKKESTPDSDVIFKTAPNTPVLSRENFPRQITVPAELPSIVEDFKHMERNLEQDENISENTDKNKMKDNNLNTIAPDSDKKNTDIKVDTSVSNDEKTLIDSRIHSDCSNKENGSILDGEQNYVASNLTLYQNVSPDIGTSISQDESISDISQQSKVKHSNVVNNGDQVSSFQNSSEFNKIPDSDSISEIDETKSFPVNHSQESTGDIKNEYSQEPESSSDVSEVRLTQNKLENYVSEEKFNARVDTATIDCSKVDSDPSLSNCDELLVKLITDFPDNHSQTLELGDGERFVCKQSKESTGECTYDETSVENVTSVERSNSGDHSMGNSCSNEVSVCIPMRKNDEDSNCVDHSIGDSCSSKVSVCIPMRKNDGGSNHVDHCIVDSCSNEVSVCTPMKKVDEDSNYDDHSIFDSCSNKVACISMRENDAANVEGKQSSEESDSRCESIQSDGSALSEGNQGPSEAEDEQIETLAENVCEVENLCPVEKLAENNNNGCFTERERTAKADLRRGGIENLPKIIIESVEEQDSGFARLEENKTEENCGEIYGDESSSEEEDDSEEPLTVMERADYLLDNAKKSEDSDEAESPACVRDTAAHEEMLDITKEHLVNAEKRAEKQMAELKTELEDSEKEMFRMRIQVQDLQRESIAKTGGMERLQAELSAAYKESEFVRRKLKRLEEELANFKQKNSDLTEELSKKAEIENENDYWKVMELENEAKELTRRVKELEALLSTTRAERDDLKKRVDELLAESEEERKLAQEALDEAMAEKIAMQEKYEREFEKLRSANIDREQKMLDDFEWKLREVEQACKKRLDDKEQTSKQQVREVEGKLTVAEGKLAQLPHLKQCEQELNHLRERSIETQRSLRTATRQLEQLQDSDKQQHEEIQQLKQLLEKEKSHLTTVQSIHYRELAEKDRKLQFKLDQQKTEINSEWEDKMRRETQRIKTESDRHHRTEKLQALDEAKSQHQQKLKELESSWEKKHIACVKEIDSLKTKLSEKEDYYKQEFETIQTKADRDIFDLRRKLDKIDMSYQEQIEKMQLKHEKELEKVREEADRRIQQCELNAQHQVGASRTTIELVKEQMQRESQQQLQQLSEHHRRQLEEQWEQLVQERDDAIAMIEQKHRSSMEKLRNELDSIYKGKNSRETELMDTLSHMRQELSGKTTQIGSLETNVEELQGNLEVLNCEVNNKAQQISKVMKEGEEVLRQREQQLQETFQSQLEEMNDRHRKEIGAWQSNVDELHKKIASLAKRDENKDNSSAAKKIEELAKQLKEKEQQIATLTKEKHLYQLELMNKDKESVQAKQRRKGGRGRHQGGRGQRC